MTQEKASTRTRKKQPEPAAEAERMAKSNPAARAVKDDGKTDSAKAAKTPGSDKNPDGGAKSAPSAAAKAKTVKPLPRDFLMDVAAHVRDAVRPTVRDARGREIVGSASSGDATFKLDQIAEKALLTYLRRCDQPVAYYSEDAGYTTFSSGPPQYLLVVDPVDGSRAAKSGFESCVVSVAATRVIERPQLGDVDNACVMEIAGDRIFYAERGKGSRIYRENSSSFSRPKPSTNTDLEMVSWSMTVPARPAELVFPTAARLIDLTSLKGGFFACNSTSFSLTRLLTNQLDACVDFANRFYRDIPEAVQDQFINAGRGIVLGMAPYDLAASLLIAEEGGCVVTDAYGDRLDEVLMLDSTVSNQRSLIAAANSELHEKLMQFFDTRIRQFEHLLEHRAALAQG